MIEKISHITFLVKDVEKMGHFLKTIFDAVEIYDSSGKNFSLSYEKFFLVGGVWIAIMQGESLPAATYNHIAFKVDDSDFEDYSARVQKLGVEIRPGRERNSGEARSLYFYDYDNHLFELHTGTLDERMQKYKTG